LLIYFLIVTIATIAISEFIPVVFLLVKDELLELLYLVTCLTHKAAQFFTMIQALPGPKTTSMRNIMTTGSCYLLTMTGNKETINCYKRILIKFLETIYTIPKNGDAIKGMKKV
jgi:hypothetical protein